MVGFNLLNPSARQRVFPQTREKDVGTLIMFAVREALSRPDELKKVVGELIERGEVDAGAVDAADPLGFLGDGQRRWSRPPTASAATSRAPTSS